jgi:hypothetical protein
MFQSFMQNQYQRQNGWGFNSAGYHHARQNNSSHQGPAPKQRRTSNDVPRGFHHQLNSVLQSSPNNGSRAINTPNQTFPLPQNTTEPIYVRNPPQSSFAPQPTRDSFGSPNQPHQQRVRENSDPYEIHFDDTKPAPEGSIREYFSADPQAQFARNSLTCTYFYNGPPIEYGGSSAEKSDRTAYVRNVPPEVFRSHELKVMMAHCGVVESIHYLNNGFFQAGPALVT